VSPGGSGLACILTLTHINPDILDGTLCWPRTPDEGLGESRSNWTRPDNCLVLSPKLWVKPRDSIVCRRTG